VVIGAIGILRPPGLAPPDAKWGRKFGGTSWLVPLSFERYRRLRPIGTCKQRWGAQQGCPGGR